MDGKEIRIAVCDDEPVLSGKLTSVIRDVLKDEGISCDLREFVSGINLLGQIRDVDLVFLDLEMPGLDGISTGLQIREKNPECRIIIASGREERFKETYQVKALRFVSKPYDREEIRESLLAYLAECRMGMRQMEVFADRNSFGICQRDIFYIEAYNSSVNIYTENRAYRKEISMKQLEGQLEPGLFFRVHRAYLVNLFHVTGYTENKVLLKEMEVPLSKRLRKEFERAYMEFDIKYK